MIKLHVEVELCLSYWCNWKVELFYYYVYCVIDLMDTFIIRLHMDNKFMIMMRNLFMWVQWKYNDHVWNVSVLWLKVYYKSTLMNVDDGMWSIYYMYRTLWIGRLRLLIILLITYLYLKTTNQFINELM